MAAKQPKIYTKDKPLFAHLKALPMEKLLETPVHVVPFGNRAQGVFDRRGVKTLGDLVKMSRFELLKIQNLGRTTISVIECYLEELGLFLGAPTLPQLPLFRPPEPPPPPPEPTKEQKVLALMDRQRELLAEVERLAGQIKEAL